MNLVIQPLLSAQEPSRGLVNKVKIALHDTPLES